jgi:hypothetical protein
MKQMFKGENPRNIRLHLHAASYSQAVQLHTHAYKYTEWYFMKATQQVQALVILKAVLRKAEALQITFSISEAMFDLILCGCPQDFRVIFLSLHQIFPITHLIQSTHSVPFIWKYKVASHE